MTARLELFLLCGVLPIAAAILLGAWQNHRRERKRREMKQAALLSEIAELKRRSPAAVNTDSRCANPLCEQCGNLADLRRHDAEMLDRHLRFTPGAEPLPDDPAGHLWRSVPSKPLGGGK